MEFIKPIAEPTSAAAFDTLLTTQKTDYETKYYGKEDVNPMKGYWDNKGYQPYEPVSGFIFLSANGGIGGTAIRKPEHRINIERRGLFGQCSDLPYMSFMDSLDVEECGFDEAMSASFC